MINARPTVPQLRVSSPAEGGAGLSWFQELKQWWRELRQLPRAPKPPMLPDQHWEDLQ